MVDLYFAFTTKRSKSICMYWSTHDVLWSMWLWSVSWWQFAHDFVNFFFSYPSPETTLLFFLTQRGFVCFLNRWTNTVLLLSNGCQVYYKHFLDLSSPCRCPSSANEHVMTGVNVVFELMICLRFVHIMYFIWVVCRFFTCTVGPVFLTAFFYSI